MQLTKRQADTGVKSYVADGDADNNIVAAAVKLDAPPFSVAVYAADTYILALLLFRRQPDMGKIYKVSDGSNWRKTAENVDF